MKFNSSKTNNATFGRYVKEFAREAGVSISTARNIIRWRMANQKKKLPRKIDSYGLKPSQWESSKSLILAAKIKNGTGKQGNPFEDIRDLSNGEKWEDFYDDFGVTVCGVMISGQDGANIMRQMIDSSMQWA